MSDPTKPPAVAESKPDQDLLSPEAMSDRTHALLGQPAHEPPRAEPVAWLIIDHGVTVNGVTAKRTPFVTLSSLIADRWADTPDTTVEALFLRAPPPPDATSARVREEIIEQCAKVAGRIADMFYKDDHFHECNGAGAAEDAIRALAQTHVPSEQAGEK